MSISLPELLDLLGYDPSEFLSINWQEPGGRFLSTVVPYHNAMEGLQSVPQIADHWFGVNPTRQRAEDEYGRGSASDVTRLAALWVDLDLKPGGCPSVEAAQAIIADLTTALGQPPTAVTYSGHGMQPLWAVEDGNIGTGWPSGEARALIRRWGRFTASVAERNASGVDSVFDLARVLRLPGTVNRKDPEHPVQVVTVAGDGAPVTVDSIEGTLQAYGVLREAGDDEEIGTVVAPPAEWAWGSYTCRYARNLVKGWAKDPAPNGRHPWLVAQAVRLACLHREGCITQGDYREALAALVGRFREMVQIPGSRAETPGEVFDALNWGQSQASTFNEHHVRTELGHHHHSEAPLDAPPVSNSRAEATVLTVAESSTQAVDLNPGAAQIGGQDRPPSQSMMESDDGHALMLVSEFGDRVRYCPQRAEWLYWSGTQWEWQPKGGGFVRELAKEIARRIPTGLSDTWKRKALSANGVGGVLAMAATDPRIGVNLDDLDADPWKINTPGGLMDLVTGEIRPAQPSDLVTKVTNAVPVPRGTPEPQVWRSFLDQTFGGDRELEGYVQRLAGLALIGAVVEQLLPFWYGAGANGKSTLLETLMWALRPGDRGYSRAVASEILMVRKHEGHTTELAQLVGTRLVVCSELEDTARLAEARIKQITSHDSISARFLYGQPFTFTPSHLVIMVGNHRPQAAVGGPALWRRLRAVPFDHVVPLGQRDRTLPDRLREVAGHVLTWALEGALDYRANGIQQPAAVTMATADYENDQDTVGRFVAECLESAPNTGVVVAKDMQAGYNSWCAEVGDTPVSAKRLADELVRVHGLVSGRNQAGRYYSGALLVRPSGNPRSEGRGSWPTSDGPQSNLWETGPGNG